MIDLQHMIRSAPVASFIFAVTLITSGLALTDPNLKEKFSLRPYRLVRLREYWTLVTSGLIHAHLPHLLINMVSFYYFAFLFEYSLVLDEVFKAGEDGGQLPVILGHAKFFLIYFGAMVLSDLPTVLRYKDLPHYSSLGASGAISGIVAGFVVFEPRLSVFGNIPGFAYLGFYLLYSWWASRNSSDNINHDAHLWGAITGIALTFALYPAHAVSFFRHVMNQF